MEKTDIQQLLRNSGRLKICAPMVRYSRQAFRVLVRKYGCDIAYTPMIMADSFVQSQQYRDLEFQPDPEDRPLVAQFAANNPEDFAVASEIVYPHVDGVGLNCGCPQRWAMAEGYGAKLIHQPELVEDIVKQTRGRIPDPNFSISVKIRIHSDPVRTVDMCRQFEHAGASYISVHGRTAKERNQPPHYDVIKLIKDSLGIPVVANGGIRYPRDIEKVFELTGADGVMVAQGILNNPAIFQGFERTPVQCIKDWLILSERFPTSHMQFHNHLIYMQKHLPQYNKHVFNSLKLREDILEYLQNQYEIG